MGQALFVYVIALINIRCFWVSVVLHSSCSQQTYTLLLQASWRWRRDSPGVITYTPLSDVCCVPCLPRRATLICLLSPGGSCQRGSLSPTTTTRTATNKWSFFTQMKRVKLHIESSRVYKLTKVKRQHNLNIMFEWETSNNMKNRMNGWTDVYDWERRKNFYSMCITWRRHSSIKWITTQSVPGLSDLGHLSLVGVVVVGAWWCSYWMSSSQWSAPRVKSVMWDVDPMIILFDFGYLVIILLLCVPYDWVTSSWEWLLLEKNYQNLLHLRTVLLKPPPPPLHIYRRVTLIYDDSTVAFTYFFPSVRLPSSTCTAACLPLSRDRTTAWRDDSWVYWLPLIVCLLPLSSLSDSLSLQPRDSWGIHVQ